MPSAAYLSCDTGSFALRHAVNPPRMFAATCPSKLRMLAARLERIPLARRAVLVMHDIDDVPVEDVAAALAIPRFTVYSRLRKARRELEAAVRRLTSEAKRR